MPILGQSRLDEVMPRRLFNAPQLSASVALVAGKAKVDIFQRQRLLWPGADSSGDLGILSFVPASDHQTRRS
jgi:hypothetical protein